MLLIIDNFYGTLLTILFIHTFSDLSKRSFPNYFLKLKLFNNLLIIQSKIIFMHYFYGII